MKQKVMSITEIIFIDHGRETQTVLLTHPVDEIIISCLRQSFIPSIFLVLLINHVPSSFIFLSGLSNAEIVKRISVPVNDPEIENA